MIGILAIAFGWLFLYAGWSGISVRAELAHIVSPGKNKPPRPTNPQAK